MTREEAYQFLREVYCLLKNSKHPEHYIFQHGISTRFRLDSNESFISFRTFNAYLNVDHTNFWFILYNRTESIKHRAEISFKFLLEGSLQLKGNRPLRLKISVFEIHPKRNQVLIETTNSDYLKSFKHLIYTVLQVESCPPKLKN